jgi:hypothetical protein
MAYSPISYWLIYFVHRSSVELSQSSREPSLNGCEPRLSAGWPWHGPTCHDARQLCGGTWQRSHDVARLRYVQIATFDFS